MTRFRWKSAVTIPATVASAVAATAVALAARQETTGMDLSCRTAAASVGFTVRVCLTAPAPGAFVAGRVPVTGTVQVTGSAPALNGVQYTLDGKNLLFDFQSPYTFTLHTYEASTGSHTLGASAVFSGGYRTPATTVKVTFGATSAPQTAAFQATAGTAPPAGQPFILAAGGDGATGLTAARRVTDLIASWHPNLFMYLGDVYQESTPEEFLNWYGEDGSYFSRFRSITDPVLANHEYVSSSAATPYFDYWGNPPRYYSVNTHGWHIVSLDDTAEYGQSKLTSMQYQWLSKDLAANTSECTLVAFHRPVYTLDPSEAAVEYSGYWQLLNRYHVTLVLNGHSHNYQQWKPLDANGVVNPGGVSEFVVGTAGNWISPFTTADPRVAAGFDTTATAWGALKLGLSPAGATYQFQTISGQTEDYGSKACRGKADLSAPSIPAGLTAKAVSGGEVDLSWSAATDNVGVTSYEVRRGGVAVGTAPGYQTHFADKTARPATAYTYTVVAKDAAGNESAASPPVPVATPAATPTFVQGAAVGTSSRVGSVNVVMHEPVQAGDLLVGWFGQFDAPGQLHVSDSADGPWTRAQGEAYSTGAGDVALYYTKAKAAAPGGVTVTVSASSPTYLQAVAGDYWGTAKAGVLETSAVGKGSGAAALSGATDIAPTGSLVFAGLLTGGAPGTVAPGRTNGVPLRDRSGIPSRAALAADATAAAAGGQQAAFTLGAATDWYAGVAVFRPASDSDTTPPSAPTGVTTSAPSNSPVTLAWSPSTDNVGIAGYTVFRDGVAIGDARAGQPLFVDGTAAPAATYSYAVLAYDGAGNRSAVSAPATMTTPPPAPSYVQSGVATSGSQVTSTTIPLPKAIRSGDLLVGWFGQYDSAGPVRVADDVNGPWTRVQGETFSSGNGDIALYSVRSAAGPHGVTVTVSAAAATYLQGAAADYGGTASPGPLLNSSVSNGSSADVDSGMTPPVGAGSLVVTALITGGNPGSVAPGQSAATTPTVRATTRSGSVVLADVVNGGAGAQDGRFTLSTATDWYVVCAVIAP